MIAAKELIINIPSGIKSMDTQPPKNTLDVMSIISAKQLANQNIFPAQLTYLHLDDSTTLCDKNINKALILTKYTIEFILTDPFINEYK